MNNFNNWIIVIINRVNNRLVLKEKFSIELGLENHSVQFHSFLIFFSFDQILIV